MAGCALTKQQRHHLRCVDCRRHIPNQAVVSAIAVIIAAAKITTGDSMTPTSEVDQPRRIHFEAFVSGESVNCFTQTGDYLPSCTPPSSMVKSRRFNPLNSICCPSEGSVGSYPIGDDQVRGSLHCGILNQLMVNSGCPRGASNKSASPP